MSQIVMITDDTMFMRFQLKNILTANGYEVVEATNGQEAVDKYREHRPSVVLMDITMPIMDGITAVRTIKAFDSDARIVMCSAMGQKNMVIEAIQAGAKDFIVKPFQPERVLEAIQKFAS